MGGSLPCKERSHTSRANLNEHTADLNVQSAKKALLDYKYLDEDQAEFFWDNPEAIPDSVGG